MNDSKAYDVIIVGGGLSGSVLALQLLQANKKILLIDVPQLSVSSRVAAGIWNPVVFKRLTKSWLIEELLKELYVFYKHTEDTLQVKLLSERHIVRFFAEQQEQQLWLKKADHELESIIDDRVYTNEELETTLNRTTLTDTVKSQSYSKVLQAGNINVALLIEETKKHLASKHALLEEQFDHNELHINSDGVRYKNNIAQHIIFSEGHLISQNPFFSFVPMKPAKGEVLTIQCDDLQLQQHIINKGVFILPLGNNTYKVGATYEWADLTDIPTQAAKEELIDKLSAIIKTPYTILKHEAGVRPSVIDRRPVVGAHPQHKNMYVFNGMGTKGVMLVPYCAKQLLNYMFQQQPILQEINITRFYK